MRKLGGNKMKYSKIYHISSKPVCMLIFFKVIYMYNDKVILLKREVIPLIPDYMIPLDSFFTAIHSYHRISNSRNYFSFEKYYLIIVHNKTILKKINTQTVFDEMWYIVEHFIVKKLPSSLCFIWKKSKARIIFIHYV